MNIVDQLESQLADHKERVEQRDRVLRLQKNRDFKKLINEEFLVSECARYTHTSADPSRTLEERADALAIAQSAGHLKRFLSVTVQMGNVAANQIGDVEEELVSARVEEDAA